MKNKKIRNDLILIISLLAVFAVILVVLYISRTSANLIANIYVQNHIVKRVNLNGEDQEFKIEGTNGDLTVSVLDKKIAIIESSCPHKDCIQMGYIGETNRPIICAYNQVYIQIEGALVNDVEI